MPRDSGRNSARSATKPVPTRHSSRPCAFCEDRSEWVDYKDTTLLGRFLSDRGRIRARRLSGNCARHQREVAVAIKSARELALLPYAQRSASDRRPGRGPGQRSSSHSIRSDEQIPSVGKSVNPTELGDIHSSKLEEVDA